MEWCAKAMHQASVSEPDEATGYLCSEEIPRWREVPKSCGFKIERIGGRDNQRWATFEEQMAQCQEYGKYLAWARNKCGLTVEEFHSSLRDADSTAADSRGTAGLPLALRQPRSSKWGRTSRRAHAVLLCRVAGLRKAAASGVVGSLGGSRELERLLALGSQQLQGEGVAGLLHMRRAGYVDAPDGQYVGSAARARVVVGLFLEWLVCKVRAHASETQE